MSFTLRSTLLGLALFSTQAAAVEFSFLSSIPASTAFGNSYTQTLDSLSVTATAWSTTGAKGKYETAALGIYDGWGMGVCNRIEGVSCSDTNMMHTLNNRDADDLILFTFSQRVSLGNLSLRQFGIDYNTQGDSDLSLWAGSGTPNLLGTAPSSLGTQTPFINNKAPNGIYAVNLAGLVGSYDWLAVSARIMQKDDFIKLRSLTVQAATPVPEADSWAMLLAGLGLVGFAVRRRT